MSGEAKRRIMAFALSSVAAMTLYCAGVYLSGWHFHRCEIAVEVYVFGLFISVGAGFIGATFPGLE
jgi:hypothetical protein